MAMQIATKLRTHNDYTVGWVCALPKEQTAATAMLDRRHANLPKPSNDSNTYTLGSIGKHNIVIACLPKGQIGNNPAAIVAARMISTFSSIKFGLMVGIGGGIPSKVRLGDVVVSAPIGQFPGVVQWDMGKAKEGGSFERTGSLNNPPTSLLTALTRLETDDELIGTNTKILEHLEEMKEKWPRLAPKYLRSDMLEDPLFIPDNSARSWSRWQIIFPMLWETILVLLRYLVGWWAFARMDCAAEQVTSTTASAMVGGAQRKTGEMCVHYGLIASGNQVIKDAEFRDKLNNSLGGHVLCVEMEAAGLMNNFPSIVIRGICDYADSRKNKDWQEHAAAVAAAFAKELLGYVQPSDVDRERTVNDILGTALQTLDEIKQDTAVTRAKIEKEEDIRIIHWLTPVDYGPQQSDYISRRQAGTGQWLLDSAEFQTWIESDGKTLFCPGIPGAGKTIMSSIVVDQLNVKFGNDASVGTAYIYCSYKEQQKQKPEDLVSSLLKQLAQQQPTMPTIVKRLFARHKAKKTRPLLDEIIEALDSTIRLYSKVFIVIDALDEYHESNGDTDNGLLSAVSNLQHQTRLHLFVTSRYVEMITSKFQGCMFKEIRAQDDDIRRYVNARMPQLLQSHISKHPEVQDIVREITAKAAGGMFLLAQLHMDSLMSQPTLGHVKQTLRNLPRGFEGLDETYRQAMERITHQPEGYRKLANRLLSWVTHAKRALSPVEIQHALAVEAGMREMDKDFLLDIEIFGSICAGLVTVDTNSNIVRLVHYTTKEYFTRTSSFEDAQTDITTVCITYLSFDVFETGFCRSDEEFEARLQTNVLYDYAARYWGYHAHRGLIKEDLILDLLESTPKVSAASQAMMVSRRRWPGYSQRVPTNMTGVHVAAYIGIERAIKGLLNNKSNLEKVKVDCIDTYRRTPLSWAAKNGNEAVVKLLLETGQVNVNSKDTDGRTPLSRAVQNGNEAVVRLLLETGQADVDSKDTSRWTPLWWAAYKGNEAVVKLLLETGQVNVNSKDIDEWTPLLWAAYKGNEAVVKLLLETGQVNVDFKDTYGRTPLSRAAQNGNEAVVKLLLETGQVEIDSKDTDRRTPLLWAAQNGNKAVVKLLLETGQVDIDSKDTDGRTPLSWAAQNRNETVVRLLLETGQVNVDSKDTDRGRTPLSWAAQNGNKAVVKLLLETGQVNVDSKDTDGGRTPLSRAVQNGNKAVVKLLLETGQVNVNSKDTDKWTPLSWAAYKGNKAVVKLLLETGQVNVDFKDTYGRTPLSWAAQNGNEVVVKLLLETGQVEIDSKDTDGRTPLSWAAQNRNEAVVKLLLETGQVNVDSKDTNRGRTPLSRAAQNGNETVVRLLLETGQVDVNSKDTDGRTPLRWATYGRNEAVVKLLLETG